MKARLALLMLAVVASGVVSVGAAEASPAAAAATRVTIRGPQGDFQGKIFSTKKSCLGGRTVKVYKQKGQDQDPSSDTMIASDFSEKVGDHGEWSVGNTGEKNGRFYARATRFGNLCKAGSSKTIKLVNGVPQ